MTIPAYFDTEKNLQSPTSGCDLIEKPPFLSGHLQGNQIQIVLFKFNNPDTLRRLVY